MPLITGSYPTFLGGVSQQDDTVRNPSQLSEAINAWLHAAMGAGKRPPAEFVSILRGDLDPMSHFHSIVRDADERYIVAIGNRSVRVFDHETGKEYQVVPTRPEDLEYLACDGKQPWTIFATATLADLTFIVNRTKVVKLADELSPGHITNGVQTIGDLPKGAAGNAVPLGAIYQVSGTAESPFDDFYVQKSGGNTWTECAKPGIKHRFDRATMPHVLKRIPDATHADGLWFSFGAPEWDVRPAGDDESNPPPSLVGNRIRDVFTHRNRVGFLSTENVLMTQIDSPFQLWRTSVLQVLDDDPIDVSVPTNGVAALNFAVPFQSALFLAATGAQFLMTAEPYMAAKYVKTDPINNYGSSYWVRPQLVGDSLYIVDDNGEFAQVREYFMDDLSITGDAADVTAHVPRYLKGRIRSMAPAAGADCVFFAADDPSPSQLYVYFVRWAGDEKHQSAWTRWTLSGVGKVVHMHAIGDVLYVVAESPGGGCELLKLNMALNLADNDATTGYSFLLDRAVTVQPVYQPLGNYTDIVLPYVMPEGAAFTVLKTDDWDAPGAYLDLPAGTAWVNGGTTLRIPGNHAHGRVVVGMDYEHRLTLSKPLLRQEGGGAVLVGRTQVRDIEVAYKDAAYFEVEVETKGTGRRETYLASHSGAYTARTLDDSAFRLSAPTFHSGSRRFPVLANADACRIHLVNRLPFQCWFQSAQWRGLFVTRSRV